jgi:hypothetical protein
MKTQLALMGGLGNQLFQLAQSIEISRRKNGQKIHLNPNLGHYRTNSLGQPEICSFDIPQEIVILDRRFYRKWLGKLLGHRRKIMLNPVGIENFAIYRNLLSIVVFAHTFLILGSRGRVQIIEEIGFQDIQLFNQNTIYMGYFQTFRYSESTQSKLMKLSSRENEETQAEYKSLANQSNPLVVHIRLGDYLLESKFGVPSSDYYEISIQRQMSTNFYDSIWLFSDDFERALDFIPEQYRSLVRCVDEAQKSSAATLEIMRLGKGYIIGNSTFSWWGAKLSYQENPIVIAPDPWFQGMPEPKKLIPPEWQRVKAWES